MAPTHAFSQLKIWIYSFCYSFIFEIDRGALFGRIIFNGNANNNADCTLPQDAHEFVPIHCEITGFCYA